ncbi:MAG: rhodanese-like domain-containing protein [Dinoroseobacter sp.]|nr:rhodanese-like domain-containing protein [Dinoroseobacter sp.]
MRVLSRRAVFIAAGAAAIGLGGFLGFTSWSARSDAAGVLTPPEAFRAAADGDILLVDIRRPDEWDATGLPENALPLDMLDDGFLVQLQAARASDTQPVAVICARGIRSARLTRRLAEAGIAPIFDVAEGVLGSGAGPGWLKRGLPLQTVN